jgi:hypothetical protein
MPPPIREQLSNTRLRVISNASEHVGEVLHRVHLVLVAGGDLVAHANPPGRTVYELGLQCADSEKAPFINKALCRGPPSGARLPGPSASSGLLGGKLITLR